MRCDTQKEGGQGGEEHVHMLIWACGRIAWPGFASCWESIGQRVF